MNTQVFKPKTGQFGGSLCKDQAPTHLGRYGNQTPKLEHLELDLSCQSRNSKEGKTGYQPKWSELREAISRMLCWYRSRDIEKVTAATHWFVSIDIQRTLARLIEDLQNGNLEEVEAAKESLVAFSELALKRVVALLDDPELHAFAREILAEMDEHVLPHLLRMAAKAGSENVRLGILRSLVGHLDDIRARRVLADALRSSDPVEAALVCQDLLEVGPRGQRIIEVVYPRNEAWAA